MLFTKRPIIRFMIWLQGGVLLTFMLGACTSAQPSIISPTTASSPPQPYPVPQGNEGPTPVDGQNPSFSPYTFQTSDPGYATLHGRLIVLDPLSIMPAPDDAIYLVPLDLNAPVTTIPQFAEGEVPQADVDERTGEFVFVNITPGRYAVVAVTMGGNQMPTRKMLDNSLAIFDVADADLDQVMELGDISLP